MIEQIIYNVKDQEKYANELSVAVAVKTMLYCPLRVLSDVVIIVAFNGLKL